VKRARTLVLLLFFLALYGPVLFYNAVRAPISLDENLGLERISRSPAQFDVPLDHYYAIDHPALFRWINRAVLGALGVEIGEVPRTDHTQSVKWNVNHRAAPRHVVRILQRANAAALVGALAALFFVARAALASDLWGFLVAAPLGLSTNFGVYVGGYIWTDAYLAFFLAWALFFWVLFGLSPEPTRVWRIVVMGIVVGLAVSTKLNAGLLLAAYVAYLAVVCKGWGRIWRAAFFVAVAFAVFAAVNPVMWRGGPLWWWHIAGEIVRHRFNVIEMHAERFGESAFTGRLAKIFPMWYLLPIYALIVWTARGERWFLPVFLWSIFLVAGTALTINQPWKRYLMPLDMGMVVLVMLSAITLARRLSAPTLTVRDLVRWGRGGTSGTGAPRA